jgi:hypothetical protein
MSQRAKILFARLAVAVVMAAALTLAGSCHPCSGDELLMQAALLWPAALAAGIMVACAIGAKQDGFRLRRSRGATVRLEHVPWG